MICNNNYLADILRVCDIKDLIWVMRFKSPLVYFGDILNINNIYCDNMVNQIYQAGLQHYTVNISDTKASFLDLHLTISNDTVSTKIYDKHDDFDFKIGNSPFNGDVSCSKSSGVNISQLIRFVRASSHVADVNNLNLLLTQKLLKPWYQYQKLYKTFSLFYRGY